MSLALSREVAEVKPRIEFPTIDVGYHRIHWQVLIDDVGNTHSILFPDCIRRSNQRWKQ